MRPRSGARASAFAEGLDDDLALELSVSWSSAASGTAWLWPEFKHAGFVSRADGGTAVVFLVSEWGSKECRGRTSVEEPRCRAPDRALSHSLGSLSLPGSCGETRSWYRQLISLLTGSLSRAIQSQYLHPGDCDLA